MEIEWNDKTYKLKPCPFCGEDDLKLIVSKEIGPIGDIVIFTVSCRDSDCFVAGRSTLSAEKAIAHWNRREDGSEEIKKALVDYVDVRLNSTDVVKQAESWEKIKKIYFREKDSV